MEETEATHIVIRPAPDHGVTVNGVGLWPDGPKDRQGYVFGSKGPWNARYNFETGHAEAQHQLDYYQDKEDPLAGTRAVGLMVLSIMAAGAAFVLWLLFF